MAAEWFQKVSRGLTSVWKVWNMCQKYPNITTKQKGLKKGKQRATQVVVQQLHLGSVTPPRRGPASLCLLCFQSSECRRARGELTRIPESGFSSILRDLVGKDPLPLCCFLTHCLEWTRPPSGYQSSRRLLRGPRVVAFTPSRRARSLALSLRLGFPPPLLCRSQVLLGVALPLCVNSALIQKLF